MSLLAPSRKRAKWFPEQAWAHMVRLPEMEAKDTRKRAQLFVTGKKN